MVRPNTGPRVGATVPGAEATLPNLPQDETSSENESVPSAAGASTGAGAPTIHGEAGEASQTRETVGRRTSIMLLTDPEARLVRDLLQQEGESFMEKVSSIDPLELKRALQWLVDTQGEAADQANERSSYAEAKDTELREQQQKIRNLEEDLQQWQSRTRRAHEERADIADERNALQQEIDQSTRGRRSPTPGFGKSEKLPDPPAFGGGTHAEWRVFRSQLETKLKVNNDRFPTDLEQVAYLKSRLTATPLELVLNLEEALDTLTAREAVQKLALQYEDHFAMRTARENYQKCYQKNRAFDEFLGEFQKHAIAARIDENTQFYDLRDRISGEIQIAMAADRSTTLNELIETARLVARNQQQTARASAKAVRFTPKASIAAPPEPTQTVRDQAPRQALRQTTDLSRITCYGCGQKGHYANKCPKSSDQGNDKPVAKA
jgi:Zinc knuckle